MARFIAIVAIVGIALMCVLAEEKYDDQYDDIDVTQILENDKIRAQYYECFMGTSPCKTADARFFKDIFSEALVTKCVKCTEKQKVNIDLIVDWYTKNQPEEWQNIVAKSVEDMKKKNAE